MIEFNEKGIDKNAIARYTITITDDCGWIEVFDCESEREAIRLIKVIQEDDSIVHIEVSALVSVDVFEWYKED